MNNQEFIIDNKKTGYIPTFGVEIHAQLLTNTKAFSNSKNENNPKPNVNISALDLGYPGVKPLVNKKMIEFGYRIAKALNTKIPNFITFDRKNYYYPDLPKGFQITQYFNPIGRNGKFLIIDQNGNSKEILISDIHLEEDTAKKVELKNNLIGYDFNRAGIPLIEIVSDHNQFENIEDVLNYVKQLADQLILIRVNDGKLFEGSFRVDVNVSVRKKDSKNLGTRVELKNLNSFNNIKNALQFEIENQIKLLKNNNTVLKLTKRFDEGSQKTIALRSKTSISEYNYIPEWNISPIFLNEKLKEEFEKFKIIETPKIRKKLIKENNNISYVDFIFSSWKIYQLYISLLNFDIESKKILSFLSTTFKARINFLKIDIFKIDLDSNNLAEAVILNSENKITNKELSELVDKLLFKKDIKIELKKYKAKKQLSNKEVDLLITDIIKNNIWILKENSQRPERIEKFIMGQIMQKTKGNVNPKEVMLLIKKHIDKYE